jgi:hypothetical protein
MIRGAGFKDSPISEHFGVAATGPAAGNHYNSITERRPWARNATCRLAFRMQPANVESGPGMSASSEGAVHGTCLEGEQRSDRFDECLNLFGGSNV